MIKVERLAGIVGVLMVGMLAASGCASKKYVSRQIAPVNQKLGQFEKQTNDRLAWLNNQMKTDVSQLNERISTTDQNVAQLSTAVQSAQGSASRAMEAAESAKTANAAAIENLQSDMSNALNYKMIDKTEVLFGFNKTNLTTTAKSTLDEVATKFKSMPRGVVELAGFTDPIGGSKYNLDLSRRRAWAVQRYLVAHDVPLRSIHMVGLGKEEGPAEFAPENSGSTRSDRNRAARRVNIRVFGAGDITSSGESQ